MYLTRDVFLYMRLSSILGWMSPSMYLTHMCLCGDVWVFGVLWYTRVYACVYIFIRKHAMRTQRLWMVYDIYVCNVYMCMHGVYVYEHVRCALCIYVNGFFMCISNIHTCMRGVYVYEHVRCALCIYVCGYFMCISNIHTCMRGVYVYEHVRCALRIYVCGYFMCISNIHMCMRAGIRTKTFHAQCGGYVNVLCVYIIYICVCACVLHRDMECTFCPWDMPVSIIYIYIYTYIHTYRHAHTHTYVEAHIHTHVFV
jgi:hypothetical protein